MSRIKFLLLSVITIIIIAFSIRPGHADNTPRILHETLLDGIMLDYKTGEFGIDGFTALYLPEPLKKSNTIYSYNPVDGGELYATLTDESGDVLTRFDFFAEMKEPTIWIVQSHKETENKTKNKASKKRVKLAVGNYNLNFFVGGKQFYLFPFEVSVLQSEDPFVPVDVHMLEGDWNNLGYLNYTEGDPEQKLIWKVWLRNVGRDGYEHKKITAVAELYKGEKLLAESNKGNTRSVFPEWTQYGFDLNLPGGSANGLLKAKDILGNDGNYKLKMTIDGKPYATWKFEVVNGMLSNKGRTLRLKANPLTFVEGGQEAWWYTKE